MAEKDALMALVEVSAIASANAEKQKILKTKADMAKKTLRDHMITNKKRFMPAGNEKYAVLKKKVSKPSLNDEFLSVIYLRHVQVNLKRDCPEAEINSFLQILHEAQSKLSETSYDVTLTKSKPVSMLL